MCRKEIITLPILIPTHSLSLFKWTSFFNAYTQSNIRNPHSLQSILWQGVPQLHKLHFLGVTCMHSPMWYTLEVRSCQGFFRITLLQKLIKDKMTLHNWTHNYSGILVQYKTPYKNRKLVIILVPDFPAGSHCWERMKPFFLLVWATRRALDSCWWPGAHPPILQYPRIHVLSKESTMQTQMDHPFPAVWMSSKAHQCALLLGAFWTDQMHIVALGSACHVKANLPNLTT